MNHSRTSSDLDEEHLLAGEYEKNNYPRSQRQSRTRQPMKCNALPWSLAFNAIFLFLSAFTWIWSLRLQSKAYIPNEVYSPAQSAVEYKTVVFSGALHGEPKTEYQGDSDEVNARWEDLYNQIGISQIPASSAAHLPNATTPTAHDPSLYMVELDVFHQLHCLNLLRKLVYPKTFPLDLTSDSDEVGDNVYHLEHCYEQLRQSIQCASDTATIYWEWSEEKQKMFGNLRTTHTCKDFGKIREWAAENMLKEEFDWFKRPEGAPLRQSGFS